MENIVLKNLLKIEEQTSIYDEKIWGLPLWSFIKRKYRNRYIWLNDNIPPMSNHPSFNLWSLLHSFIVSFWQVLSLFIHPKKITNLFLGFQRMEKVDGTYIDKLVDPIIISTDAKDDYVYLERGRSGVHYSPRYIDNIIWTEFIDNFCFIIACFLFPFFYLFNFKTYGKLINNIKQLLPISLKEQVQICYTTTAFLLKTLFLCLIIKKLGVKRIFAPIAVIHYPYIAACKLAKIPCYEIQHGITVGQTSTYFGEYRPECYPDYFLAFGHSSVQERLFGVPLEKMINIGCAFKSFLKGRDVVMLKNTYLLLSEPEISEKMVNTIIELAELYPKCTFHLRLHPQEKLNQYLRDLLDKLPNTKLIETVENSTIACMAYEGVIAENTTVLYEAVSVGVKAARLQYNGFHTIHFENEPRDLFFYMKKSEDFSTFVNNFNASEFNKELFYSTFDSKAFNLLLMK